MKKEITEKKEEWNDREERMVEGLIDTGQQSSLRAAFGATSTATFPQFAVSSNMEQQFYGSSIAGQRISENEQKIIAQAEFYLSEDYLTKNAYLLRQVSFSIRNSFTFRFLFLKYSVSRPGFLSRNPE